MTYKGRKKMQTDEILRRSLSAWPTASSQMHLQHRQITSPAFPELDRHHTHCLDEKSTPDQQVWSVVIVQDHIFLGLPFPQKPLSPPGTGLCLSTTWNFGRRENAQASRMTWLELFCIAAAEGDVGFEYLFSQACGMFTSARIFLSSGRVPSLT